MSTTQDNPDRSLADLIRELRDETTTLLRQEVALAKTEMIEKISLVAKNIAYVIVGGAIAHLGLIFLLLAATGAIDFGIDRTSAAEHSGWIAPLVVGLLVGITGALLIVKAVKTLTTTSVAPTRTIESIQEDKQWVQNKVA